ncbi:MAG: hypothetical protein KDA45_04240 [Planctomycetales bacterium]|nr:hypothetical protein [Planctomycetales bacterium]
MRLSGQILVDDLDRAFRHLRWVEAASPAELLTLERDAGATAEACLLRALLGLRGEGTRYFNSRGTQQLRRLVAAGYSLRGRWPRSWAASIEAWLGPRLYLAHASNFSSGRRWTAVVSSRLGRYGRNLPRWPQLVNSALRQTQERGDQLLLAAGTSVVEMVQHFAQAAGIACLQVPPTSQPDVASWLSDTLANCVECLSSGESPSSKLFLSPPFDRVATGGGRDGTHESFTQLGPLQDRLSISLADALYVLCVRPRGQIESLLRQRLEDARFPPATTFMALPAAGASRKRSGGADASTGLGWLDRGAIGWLVPRQVSPAHSGLIGCGADRSAGVQVQQLCTGLARHWRQLTATDDWPYLCHCTRGGVSPLPEESEESYLRRLWLAEELRELHPLESLSRICGERRLRGSSMLTRTASRCVSFSAVPLLPLLQRRTFRGHLGRWDWEPYGVLVRREALRAAGAKAVIYGEESQFVSLSKEQAPFFQPLGKRRAAGAENWSAEREWRVLGDVNLDALPPEAILLFVATRRQALQLSRHAPWSVLWVE